MADPIDLPQRTGNYGPQKDPRDFGAIRQVGIDQPIKTQTIPANGVIPSTSTIPRDAALNPLRVVLPGVKPGNFLEVDLNLGVMLQGDGNLNTGGSVSIQAVVSFDGSTVLPGTFAFINNSSSFVESDDNETTTARALAMVPIPDGATDATVEVTYFSEFDITIVGTDAAAFEPEGGATLKVTEYNAAFVSQAGPGSLVPLV